MVEIIERTLSTAQLDEGRVGFAPIRCDLRGILMDVCERQRGIAQRFDVVLDMPSDDLTLDADPRLLDQVFTNLVSNAIKYSGTSTRVEISVQALQETLSVGVRDYGLGIPRNEVDRLFTRFYRASTTLTIPGTGIGLHLVKQFVALHGGDVSIATEMSKGSTFTVSLPRARPAEMRTRAVA
jgi:signal transduction histidine kinase